MTVKTSYAAGEPIWVDLTTPDVAATAAFYGGLFGWEAEDGQAEYGGYASFLLDGRKIGGVMPLMSPEMPAVWSCYVASDDADKTAEVVASSGGTVIAPPMSVGDMGRMAVFADPVGAVFGIWQAGTHLGTEIRDVEGAPSWVELSTRDQAASHAFYGSVFGWQLQVDADYSMYALAEAPVSGVMDMPEGMPAEVPSSWMPYFQASDPGAKAEQAVTLGASVLVPLTEFPGGRFAVVADPHGSVFGLLDTSPA